jgi:hypothetical protein
MFVLECIDSSVPALRLTDTAEFGLEMMQDFKADNLAVVDNNLFLGNINEKILLECSEELTIDSLKHNLLQQKISDDLHLFDVIRKASEHSTYFLPVVSADNEYIGITTPARIINTATLHSTLANSGGIIVLELETKNYSLTEISKIVESNGAMILHVMMATSVNQHFMQVSLKINRNDLKDIQLAFERYKYTVVAVFHQSEYEMQLKERYDSLMKYLEV